MRVAIFDLGTNTFNLLIAEKIKGQSIEIIYNEKIPVKLGEGRINEGRIIDAAYKRGIDAIKVHYQTTITYNVASIKAFGTSALRSAENGAQFIDEVKQLTGIAIEIISGDREAELICKGVRQTIQLNASPVVILDIGGGSNELIITNKDTIFWKKSYNLGIARMLAKFNPSDPIAKEQVDEIRKFFIDELHDLFIELEKYQVDTLVGASGSFETFAAMIHKRDYTTEGSKTASSEQIPVDRFLQLYELLIGSTAREREQMKGLEPMRIEMIVLAALFVQSILKASNIQILYQSNFALKEGAMIELIEN